MDGYLPKADAILTQNQLGNQPNAMQTINPYFSQDHIRIKIYRIKVYQGNGWKSQWHLDQAVGQQKSITGSQKSITGPTHNRLQFRIFLRGWNPKKYHGLQNIFLTYPQAVTWCFVSTFRDAKKVSQASWCSRLLPLYPVLGSIDGCLITSPKKYHTTFILHQRGRKNKLRVFPLSSSLGMGEGLG